MIGWKVFFWAALHHPLFSNCYIKSPVVLCFSRYRDFSGWKVAIGLLFQTVTVVVPYEVEYAYCEAHGLEFPFDDIPF